MLALKAAYLHALHPDWTIAVTFNTRSLYGQFRDLIRRFSFEHINDEPDWTHLRIMHGWGTAREPGFYSTLAAHHGLPVVDFMTAAAHAGRRSDAFEYVCDQLLKGHDPEKPPIFDAVLIDEAQDFPLPFFKLAYDALKPPKRLVFAYDELQNLGGVSLPSIADLLGRDEDGKPIEDLSNRDGQPQRDIILKKCYRNTPWALALAHALGFGISKNPPIQGFDSPALWLDVGYRVVDGELMPGEQVTLERDPEATPDFFPRLLTPNEAVVIRRFETRDEELTWIASEIVKDLTIEQLDPSDILVIFLEAPKVAEAARPLITALRKHSIDAHITGVTRSRDEFLVEGSVAISGIYRAKGNEAAAVYVAGAEYCQPRSAYRRNVLFTAITRARAWVRISGSGHLMRALLQEFDEVRSSNYRLKFRLPTAAELKASRNIQRDLNAEQEQKFQATALDLARMLDQGFTVEDLPPAVVEKLRPKIEPKS